VNPWSLFADIDCRDTHQGLAFATSVGIRSGNQNAADLTPATFATPASEFKFADHGPQTHGPLIRLAMIRLALDPTGAMTGQTRQPEAAGIARLRDHTSTGQPGPRGTHGNLRDDQSAYRPVGARGGLQRMGAEVASTPLGDQDVIQLTLAVSPPPAYVGAPR
jgi:hypothetical protein